MLHSIIVAFIVYAAALSPIQNTVLHIGDLAPEISMPTPENKVVNLSSLRGKVVLVDFWATWCAPCVKEQAELRRIYDRYQSHVRRGRFEILGVSLDKHKDKWIGFIKKYSISWPQVSDLKYWRSEVAADYGIEMLPFNAIVGADGKIVAIDIHGEQLTNMISDILKE